MSKSHKDSRLDKEEISNLDSASVQKSKKGLRRRVNQTLRNIHSSSDIFSKDDDELDIDMDYLYDDK